MGPFVTEIGDLGPMSALVIGKTGQVAQSLAATQPPWVTHTEYWSRETLDLSQPATIRPAVEASGAKVIINAAAYTRVDDAETEEEIATRINGESVGELAKAARSLEIPLVHLSTDYVFDGGLDRPYDETCTPRPLGAYGRSKLAGEVAALEAYPEGVLILRTAWVYSPFGNNFVKTMLRLSETRQLIGVVDDQIGNPSSALMIARAIWHILDVWRSTPVTGLGNVYHLAGKNSASWFDFARVLFQNLAIQTGVSVSVTPLASSEYKSAAKRPTNSRMNTSRFTEDFGFTAPSWETSLGEVLTALWASEAP